MSSSRFFVDVSDRAIVSLRGSESLDLIQRISTNDVLKKPSNGSIQTVFTNEKGRIVEVAFVHPLGDTELLIVGQGHNSTLLKDWIEKFIIMEDIETNSLSGDLFHVIVFDLTSKLGSVSLDFVASDAVVFDESFGGESLVHIIVQNASREALEKRLVEAGIQKCDYHVYDAYRILHGIPAVPNELSTSYNPLEAGMTSLVSFTKGCYVGQEVIARLDTYHKVQRRLVRLMLDDLPQRLPEIVRREGHELGAITSAIRVSSHECRGLGYLKNGPEELFDNLCFLHGTEEIKIRVDSTSS